MENSLFMRTEAPYALNFLIFIQNMYLNQSYCEEEYKFPYFKSQIAFKEDFQLEYKDLWDEITRKTSENYINDLKIFYDEKDLFYQSLFINNSNSLSQYSEIYKSFKVWWDSLSGRFSVERSIDEKIEKLYLELADSLTQKGIEPERELNINLVYDECILFDLEVSSYFAVLSINDFFVKFKELAPKLEKCIV